MKTRYGNIVLIGKYDIVLYIVLTYNGPLIANMQCVLNPR